MARFASRAGCDADCAGCGSVRGGVGLLARPHIEPDRIIYLGESLGGAVALKLALEHPPALLEDVVHLPIEILERARVLLSMQGGRVATYILLGVLAGVTSGNLSVRMPLDWVGVAGKVADALNEVIIATAPTVDFSVPGGAVCEVVAENHPCAVRRIGVLHQLPRLLDQVVRMMRRTPAMSSAKPSASRARTAAAASPSVTATKRRSCSAASVSS